MRLSKQAKKNIRRAAQRVEAIKKASIDFDKQNFLATDVRLFNHLYNKFCNLSAETKKYLFMQNREIFVLMSVELDDPAECYDKWTLHFVRLLKKMGSEKLRELSNANSKARLYQIVQKWDNARKRQHYEKFKACRSKTLRQTKRSQYPKKDRAAQPVLQGAGCSQSR